MLRQITAEEYEKRYKESWEKEIQCILDNHNFPYKLLERFAYGTNIVYRIDRQHVLKLFPPFNANGFTAEVTALALLTGACLPAETPELIFQGMADEWPYLLMTYVEGSLLIDMWEELSSSEKRVYAEDLGRLIGAVHRVGIGVQQAIPNDWERFLARKIERAAVHHRAAGLKEQLVAETEAYILQANLRTKKERVLLTGEYTPFNILMNGEKTRRLSGLIDFADCFIGYPHYDLLGPILFNFYKEEGLTAAFLTAYGLKLTDELRQELMALLLVHEYSNIPAYQEGHQPASEAENLEELARVFFPW